MSARVIAIDGVAGAGKSTLAAALAARLGVDRLDTGAMYRALSLAALRRRVDNGDGAALAFVARSMRLDVGERVLLDNCDVTEAIRSAEVDAVVSRVAAHPEVRTEMVRRQREWVRCHDGGVVEGRDIGTVVLPEADLKLFLVADPSERARRRARQHAVGADEAAVAAVADGLARRDGIDTSRAASPLVAAADARQLDTTSKPVEVLVEEILGWL